MYMDCGGKRSAIFRRNRAVVNLCLAPQSIFACRRGIQLQFFESIREWRVKIYFY